MVEAEKLALSYAFRDLVYQWREASSHNNRQVFVAATSMVATNP